MFRSIRCILTLLAFIGVIVVQAPRAALPADAPSFVGSAVCSSCHASEMAAWHGSHHDLAMAEANEKTVLGNFAGATFTQDGITSRFFRRDGKYFVNTDGPDGKLADFEIRYTFGVYPLQQYLIAFPDGRLQALGIAWDARPQKLGGQRWFHLYPKDAPKAGSPLHWTGLDQTWNFQCAECHSTELRKNYDAANNTYATTWAEINVGCEACHGPGAAHVAWAKGGQHGDNGLTVQFDERRNVHWSLDPASDTVVRSTPRTSAKELETCGVCHARSTKIAETWRPGDSLLQSHLPALLQPGLFEVDGKMQDEVYNYASFRQSRMFAAGVSCSDCHNPHSLKLVADGDGVCLQCHTGDTFATTAHHHHPVTSPGARCVACHMSVRTYMVVDPRHDHGFRIPRPDESVRFGTSNTCNDCHADKDAAWGAAAVVRWYGPQRKGFQTWTEALAADHAGSANAATLLARLASSEQAPSIARATALEDLAMYPGRDAVAAAQRGLTDADPLVRLAALRTLQSYPVEQRWPLASRLLGDPVLAVRSEAASLLAAMPTDRLSADDRSRLAAALDDFIKVQRVNADRPEHRLNLGNLFQQQQRYTDAEAEYLAARRLDPTFIPTYISFAQLRAQQGRDSDGERILREALVRLPEDAALHHALGLNLVRQRRTTDAVAELAQAARIDPADARYAYVYAIALNSVGRTKEAVQILEASNTRHPADRDTLFALTTLNRDAGQLDAALGWAEKLAAIDPTAAPLVAQLRQKLSPH